MFFFKSRFLEMFFFTKRFDENYVIMQIFFDVVFGVSQKIVSNGTPEIERPLGDKPFCSYF